MKEAASLVALVAAVVSAFIGLYAALGIEVRDNMDAFISDLQKQSKWASWAAASAGISAVAQVVERFIPR